MRTVSFLLELLTQHTQSTSLKHKTHKTLSMHKIYKWSLLHLLEIHIECIGVYTKARLMDYPTNRWLQFIIFSYPSNVDLPQNWLHFHSTCTLCICIFNLFVWVLSEYRLTLCEAYE